MINWDKVTVSVAFLSPYLGWRSERRYRQMPELTTNQSSCAGQDGQHSELPSLSIIVPARNEAHNLPALLTSLCRLEYPGPVEVIVVDDNSADETGAIARQFGVRVLSLDGLQTGWLGKPNACHQGARVAQGEWLLFTDADTIHNPDGPAAAVKFTLEQDLDGLTCHLSHKSKGWLDGMTLAAAYASLFAGLPKKHRPLNGQYILLRRQAYEDSGGFAAVRQEALEDLALGHRLGSLDYRVPMMRGEELAEVAMYRSNAHLWRGMSRIGAGSLRWTGLGSLITALFVTALMTPVLAVGLIALGRLTPRWLWMSWAAAVAGLWPWSKRFGMRHRALLAPFGALFVQLAAVWGLLNRLVGRGLPWKGRPV